MIVEFSFVARWSVIFGKEGRVKLDLIWVNDNFRTLNFILIRVDGKRIF